jgi:hypothetical protein
VVCDVKWVSKVNWNNGLSSVADCSFMRLLKHKKVVLLFKKFMYLLMEFAM